MTGIGFWFSDPGGERWKVITNRILAVFAILVVAWFASLARRQKELLQGHPSTPS